MQDERCSISPADAEVSTFFGWSLRKALPSKPPLQDLACSTISKINHTSPQHHMTSFNSLKFVRMIRTSLELDRDIINNALSDRSIGKRPETTPLNTRGFFYEPYKDADGNGHFNYTDATVNIVLVGLMFIVFIILVKTIPWRRIQGRDRRIANGCNPRPKSNSIANQPFPQQDFELEDGIKIPAPTFTNPFIPRPEPRYPFDK